MRMEVRNGRNSLTRFIAGIVLIVASVLTLVHSYYWGLLAGFIGLTHITSATIGFCPMEKLLHNVFRFPVRGRDQAAEFFPKRGPLPDYDEIEWQDLRA